MILFVQINNRAYKIDSKNPIDISIPLNFNGAQPNTYDVEKASAKACEAENLVGDTRRGGSCNFEQIKFIPHCNGTHTECVGHITCERISVHESLKDSLVPVTLVSVNAENAFETGETYSIDLAKEDKLITKNSLEKALEKAESHWLEGLIIRTLPNDESKKTRHYMENLPPFLSTEATNFIRAKNVRHLLVDVPSIDRTFDAGKLSNHRIFWSVEPGEFEPSKTTLIYNTITEMIFVPSFVEDGSYLLNLQIAAFVADASPSRPRLFKFFSS